MNWRRWERDSNPYLLFQTLLGYFGQCKARGGIEKLDKSQQRAFSSGFTKGSKLKLSFDTPFFLFNVPDNCDFMGEKYLFKQGIKIIEWRTHCPPSSITNQASGQVPARQSSAPTAPKQMWYCTNLSRYVLAEHT